MKKAPPTPGRKLNIVGLFSGIGGLELGLHRAGHKSLLLCEFEKGAVRVLEEHFPKIPLHEDVRDLQELPKGTELIAAGFPCQDLSQAGTTSGIKGARSGLVDEVFRLLRTHDVPWLLLENVPFMLQLQKGQALDHIIETLEELGYQWAYRVIDSQSMGVPQRRNRVYLLASKEGDPRNVLLADQAEQPQSPDNGHWREVACGFYWTEGLRGLGWAHNAVPTLKAGSTIGIPSPPAIVLTSGEVVKPDIRDAERLQGFETDWTKPAEEVTRKGHRWKLVGNAITVNVAEWIGQKLLYPGQHDPAFDLPLLRKGSWPKAAWGINGERFVSTIGTWPVHIPSQPLEEFLHYQPTPLSQRATAGFLSRANRAKLNFPPKFLDILQTHLDSYL